VGGGPGDLGDGTSIANEFQGTEERKVRGCEGEHRGNTSPKVCRILPEKPEAWGG